MGLNFRHFSTTLLLSLALVGCAKNKQVETDPQGGELTYESLLAEAYKKNALSSIQGTTKMRIAYPGRNVRLRGVLVAEGPVNLRAELLSLLGQPIAYLVESETNLSLFSPYSGAYLTSEDPTGVLARLAGETLAPEDFVGLLLGQVPTCHLGAEGVVSANEAGIIVVPCLEDDVVLRSLLFDKKSLELVGIQGQAKDGAAFEVELGNYKVIESASVPYHVAFRAPSLELEAELDYEDISANLPVDPGLFVLTVPEGIQSRTFEDLLTEGIKGKADSTTP